MALNLGPSKGPTGPQRSDSRYDGRGLGKDPLLSRYICNTAVGSDQVGRSMRGGGWVREVVLVGSVSDRPNRGEPTRTSVFQVDWPSAIWRRCSRTASLRAASLC